MDDNGTQKTWEKPWSTEEMRAHCSNWNLAGDSGLLKYLQEFSQNLLQKTHMTEVALDSLLEEMRYTSVDVQNASNALLMLSNNQFVENRVYDDCEEEKEEVESKSEEKDKELGDAALIAKVGDAIRMGMAVIDTQFDYMEVPASDSEGEEDLESPGQVGRDQKSFALVLEPRNPYSARPLPYLIGSKEFMEDERIGLGDEEDDEEEEEEEMLASDALENDSRSSLIAEEDEDGLEERKVASKQQWESSLSNASDAVDKNKKKNENGDLEDPFGWEDEEDIFGKESDDEILGEPHAEVEPPLPVKKHPDTKELAEELAAKLGVVEGVSDSSKSKKIKAESKAEIVEVPKPKSKTPSVSSDYLFGPPKDEWNADEDSIFADNNGMFSSNRGLFDDLNEPSLESKPSKFSSSVPPRLSDKPPPLKGEKEPPIFGERHGNLFGEEDEEEEDMFADILAKRKPPVKSKSEVEAAPEASSNKISPSSNTDSKTKDNKVVDSSDSWLFDDEDPFLVSKGKQKSEKIKDDEVEEEERKESAPRKKLPAGAQSFYANGVDPFAFGRKPLKEIKKEANQTDGIFSSVKTVAALKPSEREIPESRKEPTNPKPDSLWNDDDLFASKPSVLPENTDDFLGEDSLFAPKKSSEIANPLEKDKVHRKEGLSGASDIPPKGLFGDSGSDDEDIFSCSSSIGSRSSGSKVVNNKTVKPYADPSNSIFEDSSGEGVDIFSGTLGKESGKKEVGDLFRDLGDEVSEGILVKEEAKPARKDVSRTEKTATKKGNIFSGVSTFPSKEKKLPKLSEDLFSEEILPAPKLKEGNAPEDLFSEVDPLTSAEAKEKKHSDHLLEPPKEQVQQHVESKKSPRITALMSNDLFDEGDIFSSPFVKEEVSDDIFGDPDDKVGLSSSKEGVSNVTSGKDHGSLGEDKEQKGSVSLFDDSNEAVSDDLFRSMKLSKEEGVQESEKITKKREKPKLASRKSKDLFADFEDDADDSLFSTPPEKKSSSIFSDVLGVEEDLFSTQKAFGKTELPPEQLKEPADDGAKVVQREKSVSKSEFKKTLEIVIAEGKKAEIQPALGRKSPPRTLKLGKVIPSPKLAHNVPVPDDDCFGPSSAEDDKIVEAWMKGHPPPLRDSKVENTSEDIPGYQEYLASKGSLFSGNGSFFGEIPSSALLHSHGKERARIQSKRRPPSRKVRKTPTASSSSEPVFEEEQVVSTSTPASKGSIEEDTRSQETVEEWSTPEAGLVSLPSVPPRSNPLSPSTDEEQDFFDVLPVGRYPPPMTSFADALNPSAPDGTRDNGWQKEDSGLFEDAGDITGPKEYDSLWNSPVSAFSPSVPPALGFSAKDSSLPSDDLFSDIVPKESGIKSPDVLKKNRVEEGDIFEDLGASKENSSKAAPAKCSESKENLTKKDNKERKKSSVDDLWGEGISSSSKGDLFSKGDDSHQDTENLFKEKEDLFNSSKMSSTKGSDKVNLGIAGGKNIGKSLCKLPPKSKQSLFDDDEEDEDLFSSHPSKQASHSTSAKMKKSSVKSAKEQRIKSVAVTTISGSNEDLFEDPLMVLKRKE